MESEVLKKMHRRIVKSFMDLLILSELRNAPMSGYDIIAYIHNKFGILVRNRPFSSILYGKRRFDKGHMGKKKKGLRAK